METKLLIQDVEFDASPMEVYEVYVNEKKHEEITGGLAEADVKEGGAFSYFDGGLIGEFVELVPGKKIVQKWHAVTDGWPEGYYSMLIFELEEVDGGTVLHMTHQDIPEEDYENVKNGWEKYYWEPMREYFAN